MEILYSPKFVRQLKKLPKEIQALAGRREDIFREDPFDPRLKTHKLSGVLDGFFSFSINYSYRIIFKFIDSSVVHFHQIGTHDIYD